MELKWLNDSQVMIDDNTFNIKWISSNTFLPWAMIPSCSCHPTHSGTFGVVPNKMGVDSIKDVVLCHLKANSIINKWLIEQWNYDNKMDS